MAWRLDNVVEHGLIDNTVEGTTTGKIWLVGRDEPLILNLNGDCWRDLAGAVLEFENPNPVGNQDLSSLDTEQNGIIGDMTASRRARVPTIEDNQIVDYMEEGRDIPFHWKNLLYLEWFSEINGRVLIESVEYKLKISGRKWHMDADAEEAQKLANLSAMRDFLAQVIRRSHLDQKEISGKQEEMDEFDWEEYLKQSDCLTDAYQEVLEKYMEDANSEQKEAFVMGWDGLLESMADYDEGVGGDFEEDMDLEDEDDSADWMFDAEDEFDEDFQLDEEWEDESHPLQLKARELALRALDLVSQEDVDDSIAESLVMNLTLISTRLTGALHGYSHGRQLKVGFVIAILKRCLNWLNQAIRACCDLINAEETSELKISLEYLRADVFSLRDGIIQLRRELS